MKYGGYFGPCLALLWACSGSDAGIDAGGSSGGDLRRSAGPDAAIVADGGVGLAQLCVDLINGYRRMAGLLPYARLAASEPCADGEARRDGQSGTAHSAFPSCGELAQNECPGWGGAPDKALAGCLQAMWAEGPGGGHHDAMASKRYTQVFCGFYTTPSGKLWAAQDFK